MDNAAPNPRESNGRFAAGNPGGPGGPRRRASELRRAAEDAITPEMVQAAIRKCAVLALQGNLQALRILLDRACGRPGEVPLGEPLDIAVPRLRTAADCSVAIEKITEGICRGTLDIAVAKLLIDAVTARIKVLEVTELEARIGELERQARTVEFGGGR